MATTNDIQNVIPIPGQIVFDTTTDYLYMDIENSQGKNERRQVKSQADEALSGETGCLKINKTAIIGSGNITTEFTSNDIQVYGASSSTIINDKEIQVESLIFKNNSFDDSGPSKAGFSSGQGINSIVMLTNDTEESNGKEPAPQAFSKGSVALGKYTRAGSVDTQGNPTDNGRESMAVNYDTTASGKRSFASGASTVASGDGSASFNIGTVASGMGSLAGGNKAQATGEASLAFGGPVGENGPFTVASGDHSIALGRGSQATKERALAAGEQCLASAPGAVALGIVSEAQGQAQTVIGQFNNPNADDLFIIGNGSSTEKSNALTVDKEGNLNISGGLHFSSNNASFVPGGGGYNLAFVTWSEENNKFQTSDISGGRNSIAFGISNTINPHTVNNEEVLTNNVAIFGTQNTVNQPHCFVAGCLNEITEDPEDEETDVMACSVFGWSNIGHLRGQTVVGKFSNIAQNSLFVVGNGSDNKNRKNALVVDKNGDLIIENKILSKDLEVANKILSKDLEIGSVLEYKGNSSEYYHQQSDLLSIKSNAISLGINNRFTSNNIEIKEDGSKIYRPSIAVGDGLTVGGYSMAVGANLSIYNESAGMVQSVATQAGGTASFALGRAAQANMNNSFAWGSNVKTNRSHQVVLGQHNNLNNKALFIIGNGTPGSTKKGEEKAPTLKNAFEIITYKEDNNEKIALKLGEVYLTESNLLALLTNANLNPNPVMTLEEEEL